MKLTKTQLHKIIKEVLNEISGEDPAYAGGAWGEKDREKVRQDNKRVGARQKAHDAKMEMEKRAQADFEKHGNEMTRKKAQKAQKQLEAEELRQILGNDWEVHVRYFGGWYQLVVNKAVWAQEPGTNPQTMLDPNR